MGKGSPEEISRATDIGATKSIQPEQELPQQPKESFQSFMEEGKGTQPTTSQTAGVSPFDLAKEAAVPQTIPKIETINQQMQSTSTVLGDLQQQLNKKDLKLKSSQKYLLRNKLTSANENIRSVADKVGVETGPLPPTNIRQSPVTKLISLVTDGQSQLEKTQDMIQKMTESGKPLNPGELLLIQVRLAKAQQQLEYSSILLSKAVDDIKTLFNIQM
ncbi:MAG: hypothetical protein HYZ47_00995 [Simkania negevensis]|nr:hypothetical protein [Simkania negevensis]